MEPTKRNQTTKYLKYIGGTHQHFSVNSQHRCGPECCFSTARNWRYPLVPFVSSHKTSPTSFFCADPCTTPGCPQAKFSPTFLSLLLVSVGVQDVLPHTHSLEWLCVTASLGLCLPEQRQEETWWCLPSSQRVAAFFCWPGFFWESGTLG